jgi:hypothetical protein
VVSRVAHHPAHPGVVSCRAAGQLAHQRWTTGPAKVIQVDGHNYVELESLARLTNSSISFNGNQIALTSPGATTDGPKTAAPATGFSKDVVTAGIEATAQMREWHAALKNAIEQSCPLTED